MAVAEFVGAIKERIDRGLERRRTRRRLERCIVAFNDPHARFKIEISEDEIPEDAELVGHRCYVAQSEVSRFFVVEDLLNVGGRPVLRAISTCTTVIGRRVEQPRVEKGEVVEIYHIY